MKTFFVTDKQHNVLVSSSNLKVIIPNEFFMDPGVASIDGMRVNTIGIFYLSDTDNEKLFSGGGEIYLMKIPSFVTLVPVKIEEHVVTINKKAVGSKILFFNKDDILMNNQIKEDVAFVTAFIKKMLHGGKLPTEIGYSNILYFYLDILDFHRINLKVPNIILEAIISELARVSGNKNKRFRNLIGKAGDISETDFQMFNIKEIPHLNSNFSSITFENINKSLQISVERTKTNKSEIVSPIEKIIKY